MEVKITYSELPVSLTKCNSLLGQHGEYTDLYMTGSGPLLGWQRGGPTLLTDIINNALGI
tara:strand:- start:522 stop:701 length:180 start_codon:yes stop_codon:yes gene_type:complete